MNDPKTEEPTLDTPQQPTSPPPVPEQPNVEAAVSELTPDQPVTQDANPPLFEQDTTQPEPAPELAVQPVGSQPQMNVASDVEQPTGIIGSGADVVPAQPVAKSSKKPLVIALVVTGVVVLLAAVGGGVYAYTQYQKPENVLMHAAGNALSAKSGRTKTIITSDFAYDADGTKISFEKVTFELGAERTPRYDANAEIVAKYNDKQLSLKGSVLATDAGVVYFKISNIKDTLKKVLPPEVKMNAKAEAYLDTVDGKWAKYSIEDLKKDNPESGKVAQCMLDVYKKHKDDKKSAQEVVDIYKANQFVVIKGEPKVKDGNVGYVVDVDKKKSKLFAKAVAKTSMANELKACDKNASNNSSDEAIDQADEMTSEVVPKDASVTTTTVWISQWSHELRAVETKTTNMPGPDNKKYSVTSRTDVSFKEGVTTTVPSDAMAAKDWSDNATRFYEELVSQP